MVSIKKNNLTDLIDNIDNSLHNYNIKHNKEQSGNDIQIEENYLKKN